MQMVEKFLFLWSQHQTDLPTQVKPFPEHVKASALHSVPPIVQAIGAKKGGNENNVNTKQD